MSRYTVVLLDADGTLFDYDRAEAHAFAATCDELGIPYEADRDLPAYRRINAGLWRAFERGEIDPPGLSVERFRRVLAEMGQRADPEEMARRYLGHLAEGSFLLPGALEAVRDLCRRRRVAVVTNGLSRVQRSRFAGSGLDRYVEHLVISDEIGAQKPEPGIFDAALEPFGDVPASQVLMVGDSLTSDIAGGVRYGIDTCWYNPAGAENSDGPVPTYEIAALSQLGELV
jgi:YjjG family noncanonical pyrimidine nucleotidase